MSETVLTYTSTGLVELMGYEIDELDERRMRLHAGYSEKHICIGTTS